LERIGLLEIILDIEMKKIVTYALLTFILSSCDWFSDTWDSVLSDNNERFIQAYTEILIVRSRYKDTSKASKEVMNIFEKYDYTEDEFRDHYFSLAKNRDQFLAIIDSARNLAKEELIKIQADDLKKQDEDRQKEQNKKEDTADKNKDVKNSTKDMNKKRNDTSKAKENHKEK